MLPVLPNLSNLSIHEVREEVKTDARLGVKSRQRAATPQPAQPSQPVNEPLFGREDSVSKRRAQRPYLEKVPPQRFGTGYANLVKTIAGASPKLRIHHDSRKGFMLKAREYKDANTVFEAGALICVVSGVYVTEDTYKTINPDIQKQLNNYKLSVANVVDPRHVDALARGVQNSSYDLLREAALFSSVKMQKVYLLPHLQTTRFAAAGEAGGAEGAYVPLPSDIYDPESGNTPLMLDAYAPVPQSAARNSLRSVIDLGFLVNHAWEKTQPYSPDDVMNDANVPDDEKYTCDHTECANAAMRVFRVVPVDANAGEEYLCMALFATVNIDYDEEILMDYGYDPTKPPDDAADGLLNHQLDASTVDDFAIFSKCIRPAGMATLQDQFTNFYTRDIRSKTCIFTWPEWEESWKKLKPHKFQCGPRVAALQVGVAKSFSLLVACVEHDGLEENELVDVTDGTTTNMLERVLMRGGQYGEYEACGSGGGSVVNVPLYRSPPVKQHRKQKLKRFEQQLSILKGAVTTLGKLGNEVNDAYQAAEPMRPVLKAQTQRDSLIKLFEAIAQTGKAIRDLNGLDDPQMKKRLFVLVRTNMFLNLLHDGPTDDDAKWDTPPDAELAILNEWYNNDPSPIDKLRAAYSEYRISHEDFFSSEGAPSWPDLLDFWYPSLVISDEYDPPRRVYGDDEL